MENLFSKQWWKCAIVRMLKTMAQTMLAMIPVGASITQIGWFEVIGTSLLAGILSMLTSVAGLPEVDNEVKED